MENTHCSCKLTRVRSRRLDHLFNDRATAKKRLEADMVTYFGAIAPLHRGGQCSQLPGRAAERRWLNPAAAAPCLLLLLLLLLRWCWRCAGTLAARWVEIVDRCVLQP